MYVLILKNKKRLLNAKTVITAKTLLGHNSNDLVPADEALTTHCKNIMAPEQLPTSEKLVKAK